MQQDEVTWNIISKHCCSFQVKTKTQNFCRNEYNLTGFCSKRSCPIANSQYATVREENGVIFLYMKTAERNAFPVKHWEKVKLSRNYEKAIYQIKENLLFWDRWVQNKCKQRFNKITQNLIRMRRLKLRRQKMMVPLATKIERREKRREEKATVVARIENEIQKVLMERLKVGMYNEVYNYPETSFERALDPEESDVDNETIEKELEQEMCEEFVEDYNSDTGSESGVPERIKVGSDFESDDCLDIEDVPDVRSKCLRITKSKTKNAESTSAGAAKKCNTSRKRYKRKLEFEYELEAGQSNKDKLRY